MSEKASKKRSERAPAAYALPSVLVGHLIAGSTPSALLVEIPAHAPDALRARTTLTLCAADVERAVLTAQPVTVVFEGGDPSMPIIIGLLQPAPELSPLQTLLLGGGGESAQVQAVARVDGKRVVLEGHDEVMLKCGESSITLRKDGKIVVRGAYVETHARGVNRIKGASVKIN